MGKSSESTFPMW